MLLTKKISVGYIPVLLIFLSLACINSGSGQKMNDLIIGFENPPVDARPKSFWTWANGNFDLHQISVEMKEAKEKGMGGFDIWDVGNLADLENKVPAGPPFMGEESVKAIVHTIKEAGKYELELGLILASSWNNGGSWIEPRHGVMGILDTTIIVKGNQSIHLKLPFPGLPKITGYGQKPLLDTLENGLPTYYEDIAVLAIPKGKTNIFNNEILNLSDAFSGEILACQLPEGEWEITRYVCTGLGVPLKRSSPNSNGRMIDHFSKEAQQTHLQFFMDKLTPYFGNNFQNTALKYLYNDSYEIKGSVWTPKMIAEFKARRGYDMTEYLPVLDGKIVENKEITKRFLYDYTQTLSDMMVENHYQFGKEYCNRYGLGYYAEGGGPGPPIHDVPVESIKALGALTVPRGEFWYDYAHYDEDGFNSLLFIKGAASASHLYNQKYVEAESFTTLYHFQTSWNDLKPYADEAFCEGLNRIVFHTGTHSPGEFGKPGYLYGFGTHVNVRQTWWPKARAWNDYLSRCSYLLQQGNFIGDILYYYGDTAPNFAKQRHIKPDLGFGYDYDVINTEKLLELEVKNGKLSLPHGQEYALLVLPDKKDMPLHVIEKVEDLLQNGALVSGIKPTEIPGLHDYKEKERQLNLLAEKLWQGIDGNSKGFNQVGKGKLYCGVPQREILGSHGIFPDFMFKGQDDSTALNFIHRRLNQTDIYFVRNTKNTPATAECVFRVKDKIPELWIPETGKVIDDLIFYQQGDSTRVALSFEPDDAFFIVFKEPTSGTVQQKIYKNGKLIFPSSSKYCELDAYNVKLSTFAGPGNYVIEKGNENSLSMKIGETDVFEISGTWKLSFPEGFGAPGSAEFPQLISWTESSVPGIKYFSGIARYEIEFDFEKINKNKRYLLSLGHVKDLADIKLNGDSLGVIWHPPFEMDITNHLREGKNQIAIEVANLWNNRLVGDGELPEEEKVTNTNIVNGPTAWKDPWPEVPLIESGLLGPVVIKIQ